MPDVTFDAAALLAVHKKNEAEAALAQAVNAPPPAPAAFTPPAPVKAYITVKI